MVAVVVKKSQQSFAKHYREEDGYEGEEGQRRGTNRSVWVRLPSLPSSIYRGKGGGNPREAPHLLKQRGKGAWGAQPLSGLVCPLL
jgi:hypothetical protein